MCAWIDPQHVVRSGTRVTARTVLGVSVGNSTVFVESGGREPESPAGIASPIPIR
jgi:hypothetical protein